MAIEVRGALYQGIKNVFPHIADIVRPDLGGYFEREFDPNGWYEGEPYVATLEYLLEHISPQALVIMGNELTNVVTSELRELGITSTGAFAEKVASVYPHFVRGPGTGEYVVEEYRPGRLVIKDSSIIRSVEFIRGVLTAGFTGLGALNVRVTVLDNRAENAEVNRYVVEWMEPDDV
ncbi:MAG: hypothetical protein PVH29_03145 [Candidatus Zixiibacteriota bacterium]|jgi:hypothetical protein